MSFAVRGRLNLLCRELKNCFINNCSVRCNSTTKSSVNKKNYIKAAAAGVTLGAIVGGGYSLFNTRNNSKSFLGDVNIESNPVVPSLPDVKISRQIIIPEDSTGLDIILFQYPTCPFCCKVRAFLDYYGISYKVVEVNPVLRQQIKWSKYKKVPILLVRAGNEYLQLNDSSMIISGLATYLKNRTTNIKEITQNYPLISDFKNEKKVDIVNKYFVMYGNLDEDKMKLDKEERIWREWADNVLVHTLSPNVYRTQEEALQAFKWFSEVGEWDKLFSSWERLLVVYVGAFAMWIIGKKLKKRHNLRDHVRESLYDECRNWMDEVKKRGKFFGGSVPCLADLAVYGVLSSIEGCQAFDETLANTNIGTWYSDMKEAVQNHLGLKSLT